MDLLAIVFGIILGVFAGLVPGIHTNTLSTILTQTSFETEFLAIAIVAMAGAHAILEFIPAIFLLIPDSNTVVTLLPGHRMLMEGKGMRALKTCVYSALIALIASTLLLPASLAFFPKASEAIQPFLLPVMLTATALLLASEREPKKIIQATAVFLLAGTLGFIVLNHSLVKKDELFALFAGLFAFAGIITSTTTQQQTPKQTDETNPSIKLLPTILAGVALGMLADLLPGMSTPAQIAVFASFAITLDTEKFLALTSAIGVSHLVFAFVSALTTGKARVGTLVAVENLLGEITATQMLMLIAVLAISIAISIILTLLLAKKIVETLEKIPSLQLNALIFTYILALVFLICGPTGLLVAATATSIGLLPPLIGVKRTHLMGAIILPTLAYLAGISA
ncbi:tripartite tricarboxylate transporter permease [Candidatus Micrarchaeota archaeon]|nr:tripartite tricarboxylate transporter permease [Candidatus Micrarchaeota archaeon]